MIKKEKNEYCEITELLDDTGKRIIQYEEFYDGRYNIEFAEKNSKNMTTSKRRSVPESKIEYCLAKNKSFISNIAYSRIESFLQYRKKPLIVHKCGCSHHSGEIDVYEIANKYYFINGDHEYDSLIDIVVAENVKDVECFARNQDYDFFDDNGEKVKPKPLSLKNCNELKEILQKCKFSCNTDSLISEIESELNIKMSQLIPDYTI